MNAKIVLGTQFGDEGKGLTTNYLCGLNHNNKIVIRFSGGQQSGHTVIKHYIKHSNFGSGVMDNIATYITEHCTVYPNTIYREKCELLNKGFVAFLYVHPLSKIMTPYDVAYNRIVELRTKHSLVGLSVGTTMKRNETTSNKLYAIDIKYPNIIKERLKNIKHYYLTLLKNVNEVKLFNKISTDEMTLFNKVYEDSFIVRDYSYLKKYDELIFEGTHGILLDMDHGILPNVTYSNTTSKNALQVCNELDITDISIFYVTRCYQIRQCYGWISNDTPINLINNEHEVNSHNKWQKDFKITELDYDLINYSIEVDEIYSSKVKAKHNIVVTCLDQRENFTFKYNKINQTFFSYFESRSPISTQIKEFKYL